MKFDYAGILKTLWPDGTLFNISRSDPAVRLAGMRVLPGEACLRVEEAFKRISAQAPPTGWVPEDWENPFPADTDRVPTMPTEFPAAPAAPELCKLSYYGIRCDIVGCPDEVHQRRTNR